SPSFRVEAVDTADHWAAEYLPDAGIPIVRGWYRQADFPVNSVLYNDDLTPSQYDVWLRSMGVRYVVLPDAPPDYSSRHEAALIRSGRVNLQLVFRSKHLYVYEVPNASPRITGGAGGTVLYLEPSRIVAEVPRPGTYHVKVRWTPFWQT